MEEVWKTIEEANKFAISNKGNILNTITRRILKPHLNRKKNGYLRVLITDNNGKSRPFYIHRLLGLYYLPKPEGWDTSWEVNHIDRNHLNNDLSNLEWVPHEANMAHKNYQSTWVIYNLFTEEWEDAFPIISATDLG